LGHYFHFWEHQSFMHHYLTSVHADFSKLVLLWFFFSLSELCFLFQHSFHSIITNVKRWLCNSCLQMKSIYTDNLEIVNRLIDSHKQKWTKIWWDQCPFFNFVFLLNIFVYHIVNIVIELQKFSVMCKEVYSLTIEWHILYFTVKLNYYCW
jgi:hypothetical protein